MSEKSKLYLARTMFGNQQLFESLLMKKDRHFGMSIWTMALRKGLSEVREYFPFPDTEMSATNRFMHRATFIKNGNEVFGFLHANFKKDISEKVDDLLLTYDLGKEWKETLITFITTGILCPPVHNFYLTRSPLQRPEKTDGSEEQKPLPRHHPHRRVRIILNPDTSLDDIKNAWQDIKDFKEESWPDFKKKNVTKNHSRKIKEWIELNTKDQISNEEMIRDLDQYETILAKKEKNPKKFIADVKKHRKGLKETTGARAKPVQIKTTKTDIDVVKKLYGTNDPKEIQRLVNRMRKTKERQQ